MNPEKLKAAIEAIKNGDGDAALALLEDMLTGAGEPAAPADGEPVDAAGEPPEPAPVDPNAPAASAADAPATAMLLRITGARTLAEAEPILRTAITSARTNETQRQSLDLVARRELIVSLIELGAETPATAWDGKTEDRKPKARLLSEPLEEMRARVTSLKARNGGGTRVEGHTPPAEAGDGRTFTTSLGVVSLSASEIKNCTDSGAKLEVYAENKAIREAARAKGRK